MLLAGVAVADVHEARPHGRRPRALLRGTEGRLRELRQLPHHGRLRRRQDVRNAGVRTNPAAAEVPAVRGTGGETHDAFAAAWARLTDGGRRKNGRRLQAEPL